MLIENTQPHLMGIGNLKIDDTAAPKVIVIKPGMNEIPGEIWSALKKNPMIVRRIDEGHLIVKNETETDVTEIHHKQAISVIQNTFDMHLLNKWARDENRPAVNKAIENQLKKIEEQSE